MAQGKAWNREKILEVLEPIFKLGYSINKACEVAGIPSTTVHTWIEADNELRIKIQSWQKEPDILARKQWIQALKTGKPSKFGNDTYTPSKEWLERREKDEFSLRQEMTGKDNEPLEVIITRVGDKLTD